MRFHVASDLLTSVESEKEKLVQRGKLSMHIDNIRVEHLLSKQSNFLQETTAICAQACFRPSIVKRI